MQHDQLYKIRHSLAHLLAMAALQKYPSGKLSIGPVIDNGFYYDVDFGDEEVGEKDLKEFQKSMKKLISQGLEFSAVEMDESKAREYFKDNEYKIELIDGIVENGDELTFWQTGDSFVDLCAGGHVENTKEIAADAFRLERMAGAYWRGDENNKMLTRIYGVAFETKEELDAFDEMMREAEKRDHRKLGKELELFSFDEEVGPGLPLWLPKGTKMVDALERLAQETEDRFGYDRVRTPHIAKQDLYLRSGHLPYYEEDMFPAMEMDNTKYYLKAMNCPHHHKIYGAVPKSYRDLPVRYAEYGHCYRNEDSGTLFGLMRVRSLCMNDAHIYCTEEQFEEEFSKVVEMYLYYFEKFGIEKYEMRLSKHAPEKLGKKYVDEPGLWVKTEDQVRQALINLNVPFVEAEDEAAFYGPKIDVQVWSAIGREFTLATNQLDFSVPKKFNLTYKDKDGEDKTPICIHRAPLSTHERMVGFLIEHYAGAFPLWLAPVQASVIPVNADVHGERAAEVAGALTDAGFRVEYNQDNKDGMGKMVRHAKKQKYPYWIIIGDQDIENGVVTLESRDTEQNEQLTIEQVIEKFTKEIRC